MAETRRMLRSSLTARDQLFSTLMVLQVNNYFRESGAWGSKRSEWHTERNNRQHVLPRPRPQLARQQTVVWSNDKSSPSPPSRRVLFTNFKTQ